MNRPRLPQVPFAGIANAAGLSQLSIVADRRALRLSVGRCLRTRVAGLFLFLPLLSRAQFEELVSKAGYLGSEMIPAVSRLTSTTLTSRKQLDCLPVSTFRRRSLMRPHTRMAQCTSNSRSCSLAGSALWHPGFSRKPSALPWTFIRSHIVVIRQG